MIPKTIHYCWFGGNPKPELMLKCIDSWKQYCPNYEIFEWNESNFDVHAIPYISEAYTAQKWAFVSDYARLWIIYHHGGIYLDTDVLLHNSIDELLQYDCWLASDDIRYINTGLGFGAQKNHRIIKQLLDSYLNLSFSPSATCLQLNTKILEDLFPHWQKSIRSQIMDDVFLLGLTDYSKYAKHLYTATWVGDTEAVANRALEIEDMLKNGPKKSSIRRYRVKRFFRSPKIINFCEKHRDALFSRIYIFFSYDFLDNGPWYFIKRLWKKIFQKNNHT